MRITLVFEFKMYNFDYEYLIKKTFIIFMLKISIKLDYITSYKNLKINLLIAYNYTLKLNKLTVTILYKLLLVSFLNSKVGIVMIFVQKGVKSFRSKDFTNI